MTRRNARCLVGGIGFGNQHRTTARFVPFKRDRHPKVQTDFASFDNFKKMG